MTTDSAPPRPGYLLVALLFAWFLGLRTAHEGYLVVGISVDPLVGDSLALPPLLRDAMVQAIVENSGSALPVGLLEMLCGGLLVVLSAIMLFRGRLPVSFMLQTLFANGLVAVIGHALGAPGREAVVRVLSESPHILGTDPSELEPDTLASVYRWGFHLGLLFHLVVLLGLALALTRPRAKAFLTYSARPHEER